MRGQREIAGLLGPICVAIALAAPGSAAADSLPVGKADGVRVERQKGLMVIVFSKRAAPLYKRIAGKRIVVDCVGMPKDTGNGTRSSRRKTVMRAAKRRQPLHTADGLGRDYCSVLLPARKVVRGDTTTRYPRRLIVAIPITQAGAVHLDEEEKAFNLQSLLLFADREGRPGENGYLTPTQLLEETDGLLWRTSSRDRRLRIVTLASPGATPPVGAIGYYSDGGQHAATVIVSVAGRRLFLELAPDDVLHTNIVEYVFPR